MNKDAMKLTPREIVGVGQVYRRQNAAKRAVAIALRNRWRRQMVRALKTRSCRRTSS